MKKEDNENEKEPNNYDFYIGIFFIIILTIVIISEAATLIYSYTHADKVHCTFLWCEFTTVKNSYNSFQTTSVIQSCTKNGVSINCSEIEWGE